MLISRFFICKVCDFHVSLYCVFVDRMLFQKTQDNRSSLKSYKLLVVIIFEFIFGKIALHQAAFFST